MKSKEIQLPAIYHFSSGQDGFRLNEIAITRVCSKIWDGSISEINQCNKCNIFTKYDAFNPKTHNSTQILHISAPLFGQEEKQKFGENKHWLEEITEGENEQKNRIVQTMYYSITKISTQLVIAMANNFKVLCTSSPRKYP